MNYLELQRGVDWIVAHWPKDGERAWLGWETMGDDFAGFTAGAFMEACHTLFQSGLKYAPGPSELMKAIRPIQARRIDYGTDQVDRECDGNHVWADPLPTDSHIEGGWVQTCVLCNETRPAPDCPHHAVYQPGGRCPYCLAKGVQAAPVDTIEPSEALL